MKSPVTGNEMRLMQEHRALTFRKESFNIIYHFYKCNDSGEQFTDDELDALNLAQVHNQYRSKYGVPFVDQIRRIREQYDLSASKMSEVLGLGINVYRQYEAGEMPSISIGRLIRVAEDPREFLRLLEIGRNALEDHEYSKVSRKVNHAINNWYKRDEQIAQWLLKTTVPTVYNGYKMPYLDKIGRMVSFFASKNKPFLTALNKLMFYADFEHFRKHATSISGLCYHAIQRGPVPDNYNSIYNYLMQTGYIQIEEVEVREFVGQQFSGGNKGADLPDELFTPSEIETLKKVAKKFKGFSTNKIVEVSHNEAAWQQNIDDQGRINYAYGFMLRHTD